MNMKENILFLRNEWTTTGEVDKTHWKKKTDKKKMMLKKEKEKKKNGYADLKRHQNAKISKTF